ncbi:hypothetical protein V8C86DRAFT_2622054 [Haematococcus lacustris]
MQRSLPPSLRGMAEQPQVVSVRIRPPTVGAPSAPTVQPPAPASSSGSPSTPCIVPALSAAVSAGTLGFVFGFVPATIRTRSFAAWRVWCSEGWRSATALAVMSGLYSWVHCLCLRIRLKDDAWNRAVAGGATGVALGYKAGPASAVQSALGLGLLSYFVDFGGAAEAPPAHARPRPLCSCTPQHLHPYQQQLAAPATQAGAGAAAAKASAHLCQDTVGGCGCQHHVPTPTPHEACCPSQSCRAGQLCCLPAGEAAHSSRQSSPCTCWHGPACKPPAVLGSLVRSWRPRAQRAVGTHGAQLMRMAPVMWLGSLTQPAYFAAAPP